MQNEYEELNRTIIHGILHLLGFNDKTDVERYSMKELEDKYLNVYNESNL